jgi:hypothetical protein
MLGFVFAQVSNIYIIVILYDFCLLPAYFCQVIVNLRNLERPMQSASRCAPWWVTSGAEDSYFAGAAISTDGCPPQIPRRGGHKSFFTSLRPYKGLVSMWHLTFHFSKVSRF